MKQCPKCLRDYADDSLRFCLDDGAGLIDKFGAGAGAQATVAFTNSPSTVGAGSRPTATVGPPSNAGRILAWIAVLLGLGSFALLLFGFVSSALNADTTIVGALIIFSLPGASLGMILGLIALYRAFRARDGQGAKKTAILSVLVNLIFLLFMAAIMVFGLTVSLAGK